MLQTRHAFGLAAVIIIAALTAAAQSPSPTPKAPPPAATAAAPAKKPAEAFRRWVEIDGLAVSTRYRFLDDRAGRTVGNQLQYQVNARGRFKFDRKGRYSVYAGIFSGNSFTGGWDNTGVGTGDPQADVFFKQLYFDAKPAKWLEIQVGGLAINNGESTEITGYDNDGYIMGERVAVRSPKQLYFDEISATSAYLGDLNQPNVFRRFRRLKTSNYHQFLVRKQVNKRVAFSADYTFEAGRDTLHQGVRVKSPELRLVDTVHFENYQRVDPDHGYGFALWGEKAVGKRFNVSGGFARIDRVMLNSDRFPRGNRLFINAAYKLTREFTVNPVLIRAVGPLATPATHRTRFELIFSFNVLETLHRMNIY
jgi:hypothetical protein